MFLPAVAHLYRRFQSIVRFIIVGGIGFVTYAAVYLLLSRLLWVMGNRTIETAIAISCGAIISFIGHREWTFQVRHSISQQFIRFVITAVLAGAVQTTSFWFFHSLLTLYDLLSAIISSGIAAVFSYLMHRFFTFNAKHPQQEAGATDHKKDLAPPKTTGL